jgi:O-antigen/teichoic acid export membrane protein
MFLFPIMAVLMVFGQLIASVLFGSGYSRAGLILSILGIMMVLKVISGVLSQVLYASNNAKLYTKASVIYCVFVTVLYFLFIPDVGIWTWTGGVGAALAVTIGSLLYIVLLSYYVKHAAGIRVYPNLWKHMVSLILTLSVLVAFWYCFDVSGPIWMILVSMVGLLVYFGVLALLKEFRRSDIKFFMNALSPKQLMNSLDEELH